ncbi:methyl-accepting chemotaxis protein [Radicibacter daui]|uniref:methyl-accepting chemotaxis protein n=1 Tax=Radicibacter daui TaxID=3064829 RepID=UPI004046C17F
MKNWKIGTKVMLIVGVMGAALLADGTLSSMWLEQGAANCELIHEMGEEVRLANELDRAVIELNRAEYRTAVTPAEYAAIQKSTAALTADALDAVRQLQDIADPSQLQRLTEMEEMLKSYEGHLARTFQIAAEHSKVELDADRRAIFESVEQSSNDAEKLDKVVRDYVAYADERGQQLGIATQKTANEATILNIVTIIAALAFGLIAGLLISRRGIVAPLKGIIGVMGKLTGGDFSAPVTGTGRRDEIGDIARSVEFFKQQMAENEALRRQQEETEKRNREERRRDMLALADKFDSQVRGVVTAIAKSSEALSNSARILSANAEETQRQSAAVSAATEQASANVQNVATASAELSVSIDEIARQVESAANITHEASDEAREVDVRMGSLAGSTDKISQVVELIATISGQTNLLALNATIESARAGEAGKGFAVVANEVKTLASQAHKATESITEQIGTVQSETKSAADVIGAITATVNRISELSEALAAAVQEQGVATAEIARNVEQAAQGTQEIAENIVGVSNAASETGTMAQQVYEASAQLKAQSGSLQDEVQRFLAEVRAA